jgi:hypothetical protein
MNFWDLMLLISVPAMGTLVAYVRAPRTKAFILCIPLPFTLAALALGESMNATHVLALIVLLGFWFLVYCLRCCASVPIVAAIGLAIIAYCAASAFLARTVPKTDLSFWIAEILVVIVAGFLWLLLPHRVEKEHRSTLPIWIKFPIMFAMVLGLIAVKPLLSGFMTLFPMVGVFTAYEARHSLWTACRQIPVLMLSMASMLATMHVVTPHRGVGMGIATGWMVMGLVLAGLTVRHWAMEEPEVEGQPSV